MLASTVNLAGPLELKHIRTFFCLHTIVCTRCRFFVEKAYSCAYLVVISWRLLDTSRHASVKVLFASLLKGSLISFIFSLSSIFTVSISSMYSTHIGSISSKQKHPNSCPGGSGSNLASRQTSKSLLSVSARVFF